MRKLRRVLPLLVVLLVVAMVALTLYARSDLANAREEVDARWSALAVPLDARYDTLALASAAVRPNAGSATAIVDDLDAAYQEWTRLRDSGSDIEAQIAAANRQEALARRLVTTAGASPRLSGDPQVTAALDAFTTAPVPEPLPRFDDAVHAYQDERDGPIRRPIAAILAYDAIPTLDLDA
jgi:hypothetical protein